MRKDRLQCYNNKKMDVNNYATSYLEGKSVRVCKPLSLIAVALLVSVLFVGMAQVAAAGAGDSHAVSV